MTFDFCMIALTAFAVFGGYCFAEMISDALDGRKSPPSVTVMLYSEDDYSYKKVRRINENLHNNRIVFIGSGKEDCIYPECSMCDICEISAVIADVLFTKKS